MKRSVLISSAEKKKRAVLDYMTRAERNGVVPSVREICKGTGISSTSTVHSCLKKLEEEGKVFSLPDGKRTVRLLADGPRIGVFPLLSGTALSGDFFHPSKILATLTSEQGGEELFAFVQQNNALSHMGILNGDVLVCERRSSVKDGDVAVYERDGRLCAAVFSVVGGSFSLSDGETTEELTELKIYGRVVELRRRISKDKEE